MNLEDLKTGKIISEIFLTCKNIFDLLGLMINSPKMFLILFSFDHKLPLTNGEYAWGNFKMSPFRDHSKKNLSCVSFDRNNEREYYWCWLFLLSVFSLRSVVDKPPIGGKELLPLTGHSLSGFRLNPGPVRLQVVL